MMVDPHMYSFDGIRYDFQAVGEFHYARSDELGVDIQVRLVPVGNSRTVSVVGALAARGGDARVSVDANRTHLIEIDGEHASLGLGLHNAIKGPSGVYVVRETENLYQISLPGDALITVKDMGTYLNVAVTGVQVQQEQLTGLGGVNDGDPGNDFTVRDAGALPTDEGLSYTQLYRQFGDSWRVAPADSLFSYPDGISTATYTDLTFPDQHLTLADLDPKARQDAENVCRAEGIKSGAAFEYCVYDVGFTGNEEFAAAYAGVVLEQGQPLIINDAKPGTRPVLMGDASLQAAKTAPAGSTIFVNWDGPANDRDYIALARPDHADNQYVTFAYLDNESDIVSLTAPGITGQYELRYVVGANAAVLGTIPISVTSVRASLDAPGTAPAGSSISIDWEGPNNKRDYIALARIDQAKGHQYEVFSWLDDTGTVELRAPGIPGQYELRYVIASDTQIVATTPIEVTEVTAALKAVDSALVGSTISVEWNGPSNYRDYIAIAHPERAGYRYEVFTYVDSTNPVNLRAPGTPGRYEIRYVLAANNRVIATRPLMLSPASATLAAPDVVAAGSKVAISWSGPAHSGDYITIANPEQAGNQYVTFQYAKAEQPSLTLVAPEEPGIYEVRYVLKADNTIIETVTIEVR